MCNFWAESGVLAGDGKLSNPPKKDAPRVSYESGTNVVSGTAGLSDSNFMVCFYRVLAGSASPAFSVAYVLLLLVVTIPVGIALLSPGAAADCAASARPSSDRLRGGQGQAAQFFLRALWFLLVGWWLAAQRGWRLPCLLCASILGVPLGFIIFDWVPGMLTLRRS
ncbi:MAG UNVERIFIED_CONTAM: hypothetical protein LVR29_23870 [Microcystis novacekii LVE1205-3]